MSLVDATTGEVVAYQRPALAPAAPMTAVEVAAQCRSIEAWAARCDSVDELREADHRLAAIGEYVRRTSTEGRAAVEAARRRLELRIGQLLGPAKVGRPSETSGASDVSSLSRNERSDFRRMADHPEVVDAVIDTSDDVTPASRRRVLDEINRQRLAPPEPETPEQVRQRELSEADQRAADRLRLGLKGWDELSRFNNHLRRDHVLALLTEPERVRLAAIEEQLHG